MAIPDDTDDEPIGYKKPPKAHRFRGGESGNPGGRRKKRPLDSDERLIAQVEAKMPHSEQTVLNLIFNSAIKAAVQKGDMTAVRFLYENYLHAKRRCRSTVIDDEGDRAIIEGLLGADHPLVRDIVDDPAKDGADKAHPDNMPKKDG